MNKENKRKIKILKFDNKLLKPSHKKVVKSVNKSS